MQIVSDVVPRKKKKNIHIYQNKGKKEEIATIMLIHANRNKKTQFKRMNYNTINKSLHSQLPHSSSALRAYIVSCIRKCTRNFFAHKG